MFFNKHLTVLRSTKAITNSGGSDEVTSILATGVPGAIQDHTITSLPPPAQFHRDAGIEYIRESRCWIGKRALADVRVNDYIVDPAQNNRKYRVSAVIDDGGAAHHWLLRLVDYQ